MEGRGGQQHGRGESELFGQIEMVTRPVSVERNHRPVHEVERIGHPAEPDADRIGERSPAERPGPLCEAAWQKEQKGADRGRHCGPSGKGGLAVEQEDASEDQDEARQE